MSWQALLDLIATEVGREAAARIEQRARETMGGERLTISKRRILTVQLIVETAPGKPAEAAKALGVHPSTIYRRLSRKAFIR